MIARDAWFPISTNLVLFIHPVQQSRRLGGLFKNQMLTRRLANTRFFYKKVSCAPTTRLSLNFLHILVIELSLFLDIFSDISSNLVVELS